MATNARQPTDQNAEWERERERVFESDARNGTQPNHGHCTTHM